MSSPAVDLAGHLVTEGEGTLGGSEAWSINVSREPATPDSTVTLYDTGGFQPDPDCGLEEPSVQVRVRSNSYLVAFAKMESVKNSIIGPNSLTLGGHKYLGLRGDGDVTSLGYDENDRVILVFNLIMMREAA